MSGVNIGDSTMEATTDSFMPNGFEMSPITMIGRDVFFQKKRGASGGENLKAKRSSKEVSSGSFG